MAKVASKLELNASKLDTLPLIELLKLVNDPVLTNPVDPVPFKRVEFAALAAFVANNAVVANEALVTVPDRNDAV